MRNSSTSNRTRRTPALLALALLGGTLALGAAAGRIADPAPLGREPAKRFEATSSGPVHFSGHLDRSAVLAGGDGIVRIELALRADATGAASPARLPTDLIVVLDRSGSMAGEKIAHARAAIRALVDRLGPEDRFSLVTYASAAELRVPLGDVTPAARGDWLASVDSLLPGGGTNLSAGLDLALATLDGARRAGRSPRVVLISDGLANQGDVSREGLRARAVRSATGESPLSAVGVGLDFDEELMASLADAGTGNFYYLESAVGLSEVFASELATARETVAAAVTIRFAPAAGVELVEAAGYPIDRAADGARLLRPGTLFAGQERRLWATLRVAPSGDPTQPLGDFSVSYRAGAGEAELTFSETPSVRRVAAEGDFYAGIDRSGWSRAVVVEEYNRLQREVAADVKRGRSEKAREKIALYDRAVRAVNQHVGSAEVERQLDEAKRLAGQVEALAASPAVERERAVKQLQADAVLRSRPGSTK